MARMVATLLLAVLGLVLIGLVLAAIPSFERLRAEARNAAAFTRLRQLGAAVEAYAARHEGRLPPAEGWVEALRTYVSDIDAVLRSPAEPEAGRIYAMNRSLDGRRLAEITLPSRTVMFFQVEPGSPLAGGPELLDVRAADVNLYAIVLADGGTRSVPLAEIGALAWEP